MENSCGSPLREARGGHLIKVRPQLQLMPQDSRDHGEKMRFGTMWQGRSF